ncbi:MAG: VCBS domain-containing protein [Pirellulaceae bacterium]|nr:VCBS domain-containing protein [Pirellulaceae bacterium]
MTAVRPNADRHRLAAATDTQEVTVTITGANDGAVSGLAITATTGNGTWQYSTDGVTWRAFGAVSNTNALLITSSTQVRYIPDDNNGETATFSYRAWDQTTGTASTNATANYGNASSNGGTTAYSSNVALASIVVSHVNDAPILSVESGDSISDSLTEANAGLSSDGTLTASDVDVADIVTAEVTSVVATGTTTGLLSNNAALLAMLSVNSMVIDGSSQTGTITWQFDSSTEAFDYLAVGQSLVLTYTIQVEDSQGATDTQEVTITITGTNDVPVITVEMADSTGDTLTVDGNTLTTDGSLSVGDLDRTDTVTAAVTGFNKSGNTTGLALSDAQLEALLSINTSIISDSQQAGTINWQFDSDGYTFGYLAAGESLTLTYTITVTDSQNATDTQDITIVINGDNSAPVITVEAGDNDSDTLAETDSTLTSGGTLSVEDVNTTDTVTAAVSSVVASGTTTGLLSNNAALLAMLSVNTNVVNNTSETGTINWAFDSGSEAFDYLAVGESLVLTYTLTVTDSQSATDTQEVTVTITGANDVPVITVEMADSTGDTLTVDGNTLTTNGSLSVADLDRTDVVTAAVTGFNKSGNTTGLALSDAQLEALLSINTSIISDSQQAGTINWQFDSDSYTFGYLAAGESLTLTYTITVTDSQNATDTQDITIVINGDNSAPVITVEAGDNDSDTLAETNTTVTSGGTLSVEDINTTDTVTAAVSSVVASGTTTGLLSNNAALLAMLSVNTNVVNNTSETGTINWAFDSGSEAFDYLAEGQSLVLTYTIAVADPSGAHDTHQLTITITGTNDAPVAESDSGQATEAGGVANATPGSSASGNTLANDWDVDQGDTRSVVGVAVGVQASTSGAVGSSVAGNYGWVTLQADGSYQYVIDQLHPDVQALRTAADTLTDTFSYTIADSGGLTSTTQLVITIHGANDAPHDLTATALAIDENSPNGSVVGSVVASDIDAGDTFSYWLVSSAGGRFAIDAATGQITVANGTLLNYEAAASHQIVVRVTDAAGASYDEQFTVVVNDVNEAPLVTPGSLTTSWSAALNLSAPGLLAYAADPEGSAMTVSLVSGPASGSLVIHPNGTLTFVPAPQYVGPVTFTVAVSDGQLITQAVFTINVTEGFAPPPDGGGGGSGGRDSDGDSSTSEAGGPLPDDRKTDNDDSTQDTSLVADSTQPAQPGEDVVAEVSGWHSKPLEFDALGIRNRQFAALVWRTQFEQFSLGRRVAETVRELVSDLPQYVGLFDDLNTDGDSDRGGIQFMVGVDSVFAVSLGAGVVVWVVYLGQVALAVLASSAAWVHVDPLVIIQGTKETKEEEEAENQTFEGRLFDN